MKKEILVAMDASTQSRQILSYITDLFGHEEDTSFHLASWVPAAPSIMPSVADSRNSLIPVSGQSNKKTKAERFLKQARERLDLQGFTPERIKTSVHVSGYNIAEAIQQHTAKLLPDALLFGRRGLTGLSEMLMGSVSASLLKRCRATPLWIVDGKVEHKDFLVPVDGTLPSLLAVDHLAHILAGRNDIRLCLFHCSSLFGKKVNCKPKYFYKQWNKEWCNKHLSGTDCLFQGPRTLLLDAGIPDSNILILPEKTDLEEAHGIIRAAKRQQCGTIVMGRRGMGLVKGLFGGVSDRTIKHVQNLALWMVG